MFQTCRCLSCIMPPYILEKLLGSDDREVRESALNTLLTTARLRGERSVRASFVGAVGHGDGRRTIFDCRNSTSLSSAVVARTEDGPGSTDDSVNRAFDGFGKTLQFYREKLQRNSIDGNGMRLDGYVHRGSGFNNAFWDGLEMVFGDGDGIIFTDFTKSLDVIAHELTHGVTENAAGLEYHVQSGALNESMSDVFGSLVKQYEAGHHADEADWLIGAEVFTPRIAADALRSMRAPGTAFDNDLFGRDPQPDHMSRFARSPDTEQGDYGGVHTNSGIPNKAFYLAAVNIGGFAWEAPGHIWYESLKASSATTQFQDFADTTVAKAGQLYGPTSPERQAVAAAWQEVGIRVAGASGGSGGGNRGRKDEGGGAQSEEEGLVALRRQVDALSITVKSLAKDVSALKSKR